MLNNLSERTVHSKNPCLIESRKNYSRKLQHNNLNYKTKKVKVTTTQNGIPFTRSSLW